VLVCAAGRLRIDVDSSPKEGRMPRRLSLLFPIVVLGGVAFFLQKFEIIGLDFLKVKPRDETATVSALPAARPGDSILVASFNIQVFGETKVADPKVTAILAQIVRKFDLVAVQEVRAKDITFLQRFVGQVNALGVPYDFVIGPRLGRSDSKEQYAYIYDSTRIELDRVSVYTVKDPDDLLHREPLVAGFRTRGVPPNEAFTFSLVNVHTDPDEVDRELDVLDDVFRAVRNDGRGEDDVILLGDLNTDEGRLGQLGAIPFIQYVVSGAPTNAHGKTYDNILFDRRATTEFLGRGGVVDVMRQFNLTLEETLKVSDHFPIWAEFSVYEGGRPGSVAARPQ
jgi:deoxyribonuclease-1-like protein